MQKEKAVFGKMNVPENEMDMTNLKELTYDEVIALPLGTKVWYKHEYQNRIVFTPCDVYPHRDSATDTIGKLRSTEVCLNTDGDETRVLYVNVWNNGKCTDVYIEE
jgi:hypothetical protein